MSNRTGIILLGRGGYGNAPLTQIEALVSALHKAQTYPFVCSAFIDQGSPSLPEALNACCEYELQRVLVVPVYFPTDRNLEAWLAKVMKRWLYHRQPARFDIVLTAGIGDMPELGDALLGRLQQYEQEMPPPLTAAGVKPNSPEWSVIPPAHKHVLVCRGPRCNTAGAGRAAAHLSDQLNQHNLEDDAILVAQTGCLFPCNLGPMMVVYPDGVWYCGLTEQSVDRIVNEHFIGGHIVEDYARYPMSEAQQHPTTVETWEDSL
jgi:(2Fe-2S) ferredoxin